MEGGQEHRVRAEGELQENRQGGSPAPSQSIPVAPSFLAVHWELWQEPFCSPCPVAPGPELGFIPTAPVWVSPGLGNCWGNPSLEALLPSQLINRATH